MDEMTFEEFSHAVNSIYKKNCGVYYRLASHYGFTETMFDILYFIRENEGSYTQAQLCSTLCLRKQTVNTALKKLEKDGYIYFAKDTENKKNKTIHFTEKANHWQKILWITFLKWRNRLLRNSQRKKEKVSFIMDLSILKPWKRKQRSF